MMPSSTVAIALAKALDISMSYLLSTSEISLKSVEFRKLASTRVRERAAVEAEVLDNVERYLQVENLLGIDCSRQETLGDAPYPVDSMEDGERAALALRAVWNLGGGPIPDMTELLEERGIKVFKFSLPKSVDGLTCHVRRAEGEDVPVVVCSTAKSIERQRFTIAHELGHMVMEIQPGVSEEKTCHRFAGAFLVPEEELMREVGRRRLNFGSGELIEVKRMFGVSAAALVVRMRDLGIIAEGTVGEIFRGVGKSWRRDEPCPLERTESPGRFRRLCLRALAEGAISESKAAELLGIPVSEIDRIMAGSPGP